MLLRGKSTVQRGGKRRNQQRLATAPSTAEHPWGPQPWEFPWPGRENRTSAQWQGEVRENRCQGGLVSKGEEGRTAWQWEGLSGAGAWASRGRCRVGNKAPGFAGEPSKSGKP